MANSAEGDYIEVMTSLSPDLYTTSDLRARAEGVLIAPDQVHGPKSRAALALGASDYDLSPDILPDTQQANQDLSDLRQAAVLVPVVDRGERSTVLLTERSAHLPSHAGQISFPGGKIEPKDKTPIDTALREAHEEIGLHGDYVDILGLLGRYRTGTGFIITPVVAIIEPGFTLQADEGEVADIFEVPFEFLMQQDNHKKHSMMHKGRERQFYAMPYEARYIWGATAGILRDLYERLYC